MTKTFGLFVTRVCLIASATLGPVTGAKAQQVAVVPVPQGNVTAPQGYSVVLVLGDTQAAVSTDGNVPAAARKALSDMKDFLPYKSYRLLDAQWILGSRKAVTRLRGANDEEYELTLGSDVMNGKVHVAFRLGDPGALMASAKMRAPRPPVEELAAGAGTVRAWPHSVIDTSFTMDVGETVVVGTSRVAGDKALIVLLTAVPRAR